jgi:hypothetical protein
MPILWLEEDMHYYCDRQSVGLVYTRRPPE